MNDDKMIKIIQSLGLDYSPAIKSTEDFQKTIIDLNKFLADLKSNAIKTAKEINDAFSLQSVYRNIKNIINQIEKENKPVEIKVITDKAEKAMIDFARSLGIKLDKELKSQFKGLAGSLIGDFDQSKFNELAKDIADSYQKAMEAYNKKKYIKEFADSDDMKIYEYLRSATLRLSETTVQAKNNVDGFSNAMRNLVKQSKDAGMELDEISAELEGMGVKGFGANTEDIASRLTEAVNRVREFKHGFIDLKDDIPKAEIESFVQDSLMNLIVTLGKVEFESKKASESISQMAVVKPESLKNTTASFEEINNTLKNIGVANKKTWEDASGDVYKYTETLKDLEKGLTMVDTYMKNEFGTFDYLGRTVDDKSVEVTYKEIQKAHEEALKMNKAIDDMIAKNYQMAKDSAWKQHFQNMTQTSDELKELNEWYVSLGGKQSKAFSEIEVAQMKSKTASIEQRLYSRGLTDEYFKQAGTLREQLAIIQSRLQAEGKLTDEEMQQTIELEKQLKLLEAQAGEVISDSKKKQSTGFGEEMDRRFGWFLSGKMFYGTINAAKEARETIKDVEMGMVEIARVMDDSSFVFRDYRDELFQLGIDYGQTFANVQDIALRWAQAGYNVKDSLELTKTSLLALNTAELDAKNATESMIGIMAQWQLQAEDLALVMDKINLTADNYSVTSDDLVNGLLRSSGAARIMNLSLDETISLLTIMREASGRTGQEVGNALNSILSYIQRPGSIKVLESMGIRLFADEAKTQFRNVMEIFQDIASKWDTASDTIKDGFVAAADEAGLFSEEMATALGLQEEWNDLQQRDIAQASAGVYRRNYFIGMIERMANAQNVLNGLLEAEGYSLAENARTMETLEKKQESLKASVEALAVALGEAGLNDALKALADGGTAAINAINDLPKSMKDLVLASTTTFMSVKTLQMGMKTFGIELPGISQLITSLTSGTWSLTAALKSAGAGISAFAKANAPLLALSAAVGIIVSITNAYKKWKEEQERAIEAFNQQKDIYKDVNELIPVYENLAQKTSLTAEENEKLATTKQKIIDLLPESKKFIEDENISLQEQVEIVKDLNEVELERLRIEAQKVINSNAATYERDKEKLEKTKKLYEENLELLKDLQRIELKIAQGDKTAFLTPEQYADLNILPYILEEQREKIDKLTKSTTAYESALKVLEDTLDGLTDATEDNIDSNSNFNNSLIDTAQFISEIYNKVSDAVDEYDLFAKALKELNEEGRISKSTYEKLVEVNKEFIEVLGLEKDAAIELMNTHKTKRKQIIDDMIKEQEAIINTTMDKLKAYESEVEAVEALANAKRILMLLETGQITSESSEADKKAIEERRAYVNSLQSDINTIQAAKDKIKALQGMRSLFDEVDDNHKSKDKKDDSKFLESIDAEIRAIKIRNDYLVESEKLLQNQLNLAKDTDSLEGLNKQYELTGELIAHNAQLLMSFKNEQDAVHEMANRLRETYSKYNIDSWFDSNGEMTTTYIEEYNKASKKQQEEMEKVFSQIQKLKKAWMESAGEIEKVNSNVGQLYLSQNKLLEQMEKLIEQQRELARNDWIEEQNRLYKEQQDRLSALRDIQETIVQIIRKRGEEEKKALEKAHQEEMDSLEERHNERKKKYADDLDEFRKLIQSKIDALDEQYAEEDYLEQLNKEREEANRLQREIDVLSLDDSLTARNKIIELRKQLADQNEKIAKMQQKKERDLLKKSLQDQLKNHEQNVREKENIADKTYENERKRLEEDYRINKEFLEKKYSDEKVYAEARESIMRGQVEVAEGVFMDIYDAFVDFENKFGKGMGILGDIIKRDFIDQLELAKQAIEEMDYLAENSRRKYDSDYQPTDDDYGKSPSPSSDTSYKDTPIYKKYKQYENLPLETLQEIFMSAMRTFDEVGGEQYLEMMEAANRFANLIRKKGFIVDAINALESRGWKNPGYNLGGKITETGLALVHGEDNPEWMLRDYHLKKIISDSVLSTIKVAMPKIPNATARQGITLQIDNFIKADMITKESIPELKKIQANAMEDLKNLLNKNGVRPSLI